jgi:BolA protein
MSPEARGERIRDLLSAALDTHAVDVIDDSHHHAGHAGARDGRGHFRVRVVSDRFAGLRPLARHQLIYRSLGELMQTDIHALSIAALTPQEASATASASGHR